MSPKETLARFVCSHAPSCMSCVAMLGLCCPEEGVFSCLLVHNLLSHSRQTWNVRGRSRATMSHVTQAPVRCFSTSRPDHCSTSKRAKSRAKLCQGAKASASPTRDRAATSARRAPEPSGVPGRFRCEEMRSQTRPLARVLHRTPVGLHSDGSGCGWLVT